MNSTPTVFVVDDDPSVLRAAQRLLESVGLRVAAHSSSAEFLAALKPDAAGCIVLDVRMPGASGLDLQDQLRENNVQLPIIFITGYGDVPMSVRAMKAGAADFLEKPFNEQRLIDAVFLALQRDADQRRQRAQVGDIMQRVARLTPREREVLKLVVSGHTNGEIAGMWGISEKTIKIHRRRVMEKMGADSLPARCLWLSKRGCVRL